MGDAASAMHASWPEPCVLTTGTVVSGDLTVIESSDGNALTVLLAATGDGFTLSGFVGLSPQFWPVAWLLDDVNSGQGIAMIAVFDAETRIARDDTGVFVIDLPEVLVVQIPYDAKIGGVGSRVCAVESRTTVLYDLGRRADQCAISLAGLDVTLRLGCALVEGEHGTVSGVVGASVSPFTVGTVDATLSEDVDGQQQTHAISLDLRPLGCRQDAQ